MVMIIAMTVAVAVDVTTTAIMTTIMLLMMMVMIIDDDGAEDDDDDDDDEHDYSAFRNNTVSNGITVCIQHFRSRRANVVCKSARKWLVV